jgi:LCP family protein required for cell wall assembly
MFKFMVVLLSIFTPLVVLAGVGYFVVSYMLGSTNLSADEQRAREDIERIINLDDLNKLGNSVPNSDAGIPLRLNFLILGIDWEGQTSRADTIMVGSYDIAENELHLISIPRDTWISLSSRTLDFASQVDAAYLPWWSRNNGTPRINQGVTEFRINAIWHHFGKVYGLPFMRLQIEEMLGIRIDYHVVVELDGFIEIVNAIGGIEYNVPQRMYYYFDEPDEFGIRFTIDLHPGLQRLYGKEALDLVRYRHSSDPAIAQSYARADLQRIELQQDFMRTAIPQILSASNIISNIGSYIDIIAKHVETNVSVLDALKYAGYARNLSMDSIFTYSLPVIQSQAPAGERRQGSVYVDVVPTYELVQRVFFNSTQSDIQNGTENNGEDDDE